jgi:hypothetical protein
MESDGTRRPSWFAPVVGVVAILVLGLAALAMLGSQVSGILSTVGASVGGPYGPGPVVQDDAGEEPGNGEGSENDDSDGSDAGDGSSNGVVPGDIVTALPRDELLIIKTGNLTLEVDAIDAAVSAAAGRIDALGGYVSGSDRSGTGREAVATVRFRVPAEQWDAAMAAMHDLASEVLLEHSTTEDVTSRVVDLEARIRNLRVTEQALQAIMDKASVIKDVLTVQAELTVTRGRIEQLTAEQASLEEQAAYSTLAVAFVLEPPPILVEQQAGFDPATEVDAASARLVGILQDVATAGIWFGIVWLPVLGALLLVVGIVLLVSRRLRPRAAAA